MAAVEGTNLQVHGFCTPNGFAKASDNKQVLGCFVSIRTITGTYASAGNLNIAAVGVAIATARRDGRTVTLLQACLAAPAKESTGTVIGAKTVAISTDAITAELTTDDFSAEHADGLLVSELLEPLVLFVLFKH